MHCDGGGCCDLGFFLLFIPAFRSVFLMGVDLIFNEVSLHSCDSSFGIGENEFGILF